MNEIYETTLRLRHADVDCCRRLRWSAMFTLFQEASVAHTDLLGFGRDKTLDRGLLWVVTLQTAHILRMPEYGEEVRFTSWPGRTMHVFMPRYYRLTAPDGTLLVEASALWGLMDRDTRKLIVPTEHGLDCPATVTGLECPLPRSCRGTPTEYRDFTVPFSALDLNGHMNNTRYFDLAQDLLPREAAEQAPERITVEYSSEALWGEQLRIGLAKTQAGWFLSGESDRRIFRMQLDFPAN